MDDLEFQGTSFGSLAEIKRLVRHVAFDLRPIGCANMTYCMALTADAQPAVLDVAADLWHKKFALVVGLSRGTTKHGYAGFDFCAAGLAERGVSQDCIIPVDPLLSDANTLNTRSEAEALVKRIARSGLIPRIFVCSAFFHQLRAVSTIVSALNPANPEIQVFSWPAEAPPWDHSVRHSQGTLEGTLYELLLEELWRLFRYHAKGDLRSCREILKYFDWRDTHLS